MASILSMLQNIPNTDRDEPMRVYVRTASELAADIANAQRRIDCKLYELEQARDELNRAQQAFIDHCTELELSLEITPKLYPEKPYVLED